MRKVYYLWAAGLLLKLLGATWDVAWHFRTIREAFSPPHVINLIGELLVGAALAIDLRKPAPHRRVPLTVALAGVGLFLFAIPFDQWWHVTFGIDITTWSPAHLLLFSGTAVLLVGILLMFLADLKHEHGSSRPSLVERAFLVFLLIGLAEAFAFPLTYNEYTTVGARVALCEGGHGMDATLVALAQLHGTCADMSGAVFLGTPAWLYPVYSIGFAVLLATLVRAAMGPGWAALMLVGLSLERAIADAVLTGLGWPGAVVPLQYVGIALALEAVWLLHARDSLKAAAGGVAGALAGYAYLAGSPPVSHVPLDWTSAPIGVAVALALAMGGYVLALKWDAWQARIPVFHWETYPTRVRAWAREHLPR